MDENKPTRRARPLWQIELTTPARNRYMAVTSELVEFLQGWAMQTSLIDVDFEERIELRGRTRPFRTMELINIGDGMTSLPIMMALDAAELSCLRRLATDRRIRWCLHSMVSDIREDLFEYDSFVSMPFPKTEDELERAKNTYRREVAVQRNKR